MPIEIKTFDLFSPYFDAAVGVYMTVFNETDYGASWYFFRRYTSYPDYHGLVALDGDEVVGIAFGSQTQGGQWWHDKVAEKVGADHPALQRAWVLVELGILEEYRNKGLGLELHNQIIALHRLPNLLLSTQVENHGARRFYERLGWQYLHMGFSFMSYQPPYLIMCRSRIPK